MTWKENCGSSNVSGSSDGAGLWIHWMCNLTVEDRRGLPPSIALTCNNKLGSWLWFPVGKYIKDYSLHMLLLLAVRRLIYKTKINNMSRVINIFIRNWTFDYSIELN